MRKTSRLPLVDGHLHMRGIASLPNVLEIMDAAGLDGVAFACLAVQSGMGLTQNVSALLAKALHPGRFYAFGGLWHGRGHDDFAAQAARAIAAGCDGIKMIEGKPDAYKATGLPLDDAAYDPFYSHMERCGAPILFHVGDPRDFWDRERVPGWAFEHGWYWGDGTYPSLDQLYDEVEALLGRHPGLHVVFAHFLFMSDDIQRAESFLARWPNVSLDITPGREMYTNFSKDTSAWREFFVRHSDRIVFGTDNTSGRDAPDPDAVRSGTGTIAWMRAFLEARDDVDMWGEQIRGIGLDRRVLRRICAGNFRRLAGAAPKPVDLALALDECDRALRLAASERDADAIARELREVRSRLAKLAG